jgi:hypothetical protein
MPDPSSATAQQEARAAAQARLRRLDQQLRAARHAEQAMPLVVYYGPRPLQAVPLVELFQSGPWAA